MPSTKDIKAKRNYSTVCKQWKRYYCAGTTSSTTDVCVLRPRDVFPISFRKKVHFYVRIIYQRVCIAKIIIIIKRRRRRNRHSFIGRHVRKPNNGSPFVITVFRRDCRMSTRSVPAHEGHWIPTRIQSESETRKKKSVLERGENKKPVPPARLSHSPCHQLPLKKRVQCSTYREGERKQPKPWGHGGKRIPSAHELTQPFQSNKQNQIHQSSPTIYYNQPTSTCM